MQIIKSSILAMLATLFCIWLLRPLAERIGLVDHPGGRKQHAQQIPVIGGIAMFFGFCFALLTLHVSLQAFRGMLAGSALLVLIGVLDDFQELRPRVRLLCQVLAVCFMVIWGKQEIQNLGDLFFMGPFDLGPWSFVFTVVLVVGFINAMNMVDGQDGLAGGIALGQAALLLVLSVILERHVDFKFLIILMTLLVTFLAFNFRFPWRQRATIFMGDAGVTFIAFLIAWFAINLSQANTAIVQPITVLWILAFPLFDLINVVIHRLQKKQSPFRPGRDHLHHMLHLRGLSAALSTWILVVFSFLLGCVGLLFQHFAVHAGVQLLLFMATLLSYFLTIRIIRQPEEKSE